MKIILMMILMFGVAESRTSVVFGTNYSTVSSANDFDDEFGESDEEVDVDLGYLMGFRIGMETISNNFITGFTYSQRGLLISADAYGEDAELSYALEYLTAYALIQVPVGSLALLAGGEAGYWLSGEMTMDVDGDEMTIEIDSDDWEDGGGHTLDYGVVLGAKFDVTPQLSAVGTCYFGLPEWAEDDRDNDGMDFKNRGFQIYLSYAIM